MKYPAPPPEILNDLTGFVAGQVFTYCHKVVDGVCALSTTYQMPLANTVWPTEQVALAACIGAIILALPIVATLVTKPWKPERMDEC